MSRPGGPRPAALYHGTNVDLAVGDRVLPPALTGAIQAHPRPERAGSAYDPRNWAHATSNENAAWSFADRAADRAHRGSGVDGKAPAPGGTGRARVYRVEPEGQLRHGLENRGHPEHRTLGRGFDNSEYLAKGFRVVGREDIQPPSGILYKSVPKASGRGTKRVTVPNDQGQQGTLPMDFSVKGGARPYVNHPRPSADEPEVGAATPPHTETPGQLAGFPVPRNTGLRARQRVLKGRG